jgi:glycosyltransferase involved in cell wall biosynthesis
MQNWEADPAVKVTFVEIDPDFPPGLGWVEHIPYLRTIIRMPLYWVSLLCGLREVDLVHVFAASYSSFLLAPVPAWVVSRVLGKKTILNYHSGEARDHLSRSAAARNILRKMDKRVVPSRYLHDVLQQFGLSTEVIPNLIDTKRFQYRERKHLRPVLICTRGYESYYAVDDVIRAFGYVQRVFPEARLLLVGSGTQERHVRDLVAQLDLANVVFSGKIARDRIGYYYDQADVFVNASWLDNMPVSVLEAFESGTPVVSTAPEGIRYLVEHERTGLLSEPHDWRALGENVVRLLHNPQLAARLAENAHDQSRAYHWDSVRTKWLELYRSTLYGSDESRVDTKHEPLQKSGHGD